MPQNPRSSSIRWRELLKTQFRATRSHEIYILGCFARHVTLYSQQVRALNLIYGLYRTRKLEKGQSVAVIGGGAAGLTAAVAAAYRGARVSLFEELAGPMELQQNNRQRWIHPFVYDWPYFDDSAYERFKGSDARLPLLNWSADYAANVARQISSQWDLLQKAYEIDAKWSVKDLRLTLKRGGLISVTWDGKRRSTFPVLVIAVGFGLEPKKSGQDSYWAEDDLDGSFRKETHPQRWLLSGSGDGALTDLMRLSIHRFRQDEILKLFVTAQGIDGLKRDLRALQTSADANQRLISDRFNGISIDNELRNLVREQVRRDGPDVVWMTPQAKVFGPRTSILNRLVVRILNELRPPIFQHHVGRVKGVVSGAGGFRVKVKSHGRLHNEMFDRVLLRHGPKSELERDFPSVHRTCAPLKAIWEDLSVDNDVTRRPAWTSRFFGPGAQLKDTYRESLANTAMGTGLRTQDRNFERSVKRFGFWAEGLTTIRHVRSDGSSHVTYIVDGLSVLRGSLKGFSFRYRSGVGKVDRVKLEAPRAARLKWIDQTTGTSQSKSRAARGSLTLRNELDSGSIASVRESVRLLSGVVRFGTALTASDPSLSFRLNFRLLNGDALSAWEFDQMYDDAKLRKHADGKRLGRPTEYLARMVWFPVRMLRIQVTLPTRINDCVPSVFLHHRHGHIFRSDVVKNDVLQPLTSKKPPKAIAKPLRPPKDMGMFQKTAAHSWMLSVPQPLVGSCYSLDWPLPSTPENFFTKSLEKQANHFRQLLLRYRSDLLSGSRHRIDARRREAAHQVFTDFYRSLVGRDRPTGDTLELTFMVYSQISHRLVVVDGIRNGKEVDRNTRHFWLPFGLGMAGSCFKNGNRIFVLNRARNPGGPAEHWQGVGRDKPESDPGFYLRIPSRRAHRFLIQVPVDHPKYRSDGCPDGYESSRQCIGVVSFASRKGQTWLARITKIEELEIVQNWCQGFCNELYRILMVDDVKSL